MKSDCRKRKYHFIGIGGIGMSGIALVMLKRGFVISGSDTGENAQTRKLSKLGAKIYRGHSAEWVAPGATVVYSSCIRRDNPEMAIARKRRQRVIMRAEALDEIIRGGISIVITGAHGKTTTSAMMSHVFKQARLDPSFIVGGVVKNYSSNALVGKGVYNIVEADESDGSFLKIAAHIGIVTNIDKEHMEHYGNMGNLINAHRRFAGGIEKDGYFIYNHDDAKLTAIAKAAGGMPLRFGFSVTGPADIYAKNIRVARARTRFCCVLQGRSIGDFEVPMPGEHNVMNALPVILTAVREGVSADVARRALATYRGTDRRYDVMYSSGSRMIIHDYAHHPREITSLIEGVRLAYPRGRVKVIFQPHRFTRTRDLLDEFVEALSRADEAILTDIYSASEQPIRGITHTKLAEKLSKKGIRTKVLGKDAIAETSLAEFSRGDILLVLGAGDIYAVAKRMKKIYEAKTKK